MALIGRFFGSTVSTGAGFAFGRASAPALSPAIEKLRQEAWRTYPDRLPGVMELAAGVAQGQIDPALAEDWAQSEGFGAQSFAALVAIANTGPDVGTAMQAWRRGKLTEPEFRTVLRRHSIETRWNNAIEALKLELLSPGELAAAIHRGLVPDPGLLQGEQPKPPFKVQAYPVYDIPALSEAAGSGFDHDRLGVLVGLQGLPMGTHEAAQAFFRGIITHGDYIRAFNESNSRNEWAQAVLDYTRQIPTSRDFFENALRGHHDFNWAVNQAARHGMSRADAEIIYQNQGRPLNLHQITQALAWGAKYQPAQGDNADPWMQSVLLGPVRPEFYDLQHTLKYTLPSALYFRTLQQQDVLTETEAATWYRRLGWPPELADKVATAYAKKPAAAATENPYVAKAENQLWTALHKQYVKFGSVRSEVEPILRTLIPDDAPRNQVFVLWDAERATQALPLPAAA